jgi:plastocyanin domain-containing protein
VKNSIIDVNSGETVLSFETKSTRAEVTFKPGSSGIYGVVKNGSIIGGIEAAEDLSTVDLEKLREKYF